MTTFKNTIRFDAGTLNTASGAGSYTQAFPCDDFRNVLIAAVGANTSVATIKIYGSVQTTKPDLSSAQSATNMYFPIQVINLDTGAAINGSTGISFSANGYTAYEANVNNLKWIGAVMTSRTTGDVTLSMFMTDNQ